MYTCTCMYMYCMGVLVCACMCVFVCYMYVCISIGTSITHYMTCYWIALMFTHINFLIIFYACLGHDLTSLQVVCQNRKVHVLRICNLGPFMLQLLVTTSLASLQLATCTTKCMCQFTVLIVTKLEMM